MALAMPRPDTIDPEAWCRLILTRCGLTFRGSQIPAVLAAVRDEAQAGGATERQFFDHLSAEAEGGPAWTALLERLVNHETSFFRHPPSYELLRSRLLPELREARAGCRLNLWSAGCATGQEAYSLAMVASDGHDDRTLRSDFTVWGGDISRQAIDIARRGRYGHRAVAGIPEQYRRRFVRHVADGPGSEYEIVEALRRRVRFTPLNLLAAGSVSLNYDVIFCHNVLIYLSPLTVSRVVAQLASRLALGGYLLLGPGEAPAERPPALEPQTMNGVRVLRRRTALPEARSW
jgi:chemotaxis methyl-accepting protein methylase